jgi:hypothetical protein
MKYLHRSCLSMNSPTDSPRIARAFMTASDDTTQPVVDRGSRVALIFALAAERLSLFYEHHQWLTDAQGTHLAADWLARSRRSLPLAERKRLSALSDQLARQIESSLSREAGLFTAHEMMEALDDRYPSEIGQSLMEECERLLDSIDPLSVTPAANAG